MTTPALRPLGLNFASAILLASIVIGLYLCYSLSIPFLSPIVWSFTLAVLFMPLCKWLRSTFKSEAASASATVIIVAIVVVLPAIFVLTAMLAEVVRGAGLLSEAVAQRTWRGTISPIRGLLPLRPSWTNSSTSPSLSVCDHLADHMERVVRAWLVREFGYVLLTFYFLFYFLRDGTSGKAALHGLLPLSPAEF